MAARAWATQDLRRGGQAMGDWMDRTLWAPWAPRLSTPPPSRASGLRSSRRCPWIRPGPAAQARREKSPDGFLKGFLGAGCGKKCCGTLVSSEITNCTGATHKVAVGDSGRVHCFFVILCQRTVKKITDQRVDMRETPLFQKC